MLNITRPGENFMHDFSITIQIGWKFRFAYPNSNKAITTKSCTWHDSYAVTSSAKICCDVMEDGGWNYCKTKFPSNLNCDRKIFTELGPWWILISITYNVVRTMILHKGVLLFVISIAEMRWSQDRLIFTDTFLLNPCKRLYQRQNPSHRPIPQTIFSS